MVGPGGAPGLCSSAERGSQARPSSLVGGRGKRRSAHNGDAHATSGWPRTCTLHRRWPPSQYLTPFDQALSVVTALLLHSELVAAVHAVRLTP